MSSEIAIDAAALVDAVAQAGRSPQLRSAILEQLRIAELAAADPAAFRDQVRWPLIYGMLGKEGTHQVELSDGLVFEVGADSRIERAFLLSAAAHPNHVWEPQTTKLLTALAKGAKNVIVGGAYIGDHVIPMAKVMASDEPRGRVHGFEPMAGTHARLLRNIEINKADNVVPNRLGLWDVSNASLGLEGDPALASSVEIEATGGDDEIKSLTIADYMQSRAIDSVGLIMLDTEGGEERALHGGRHLLELPVGEAPNVVLEVHRFFVDWTDGLENTSIIRLLTDNGYTVYAVRDYHLNYDTSGVPIEIIPIDQVYLGGPPHGFNVLATKDDTLIERLDLRIVPNVSPKLLLGRDPVLHQPHHLA